MHYDALWCIMMYFDVLWHCLDLALSSIARQQCRGSKSYTKYGVLCKNHYRCPTAYGSIKTTLDFLLRKHQSLWRYSLTYGLCMCGSHSDCTLILLRHQCTMQAELTTHQIPQYWTTPSSQYTTVTQHHNVYLQQCLGHQHDPTVDTQVHPIQWICLNTQDILWTPPEDRIDFVFESSTLPQVQGLLHAVGPCVWSLFAVLPWMMS